MALSGPSGYSPGMTTNLDIDVPGELKAIATVLDTFDELRAGGPATLERRAPGVSGWTVAQHLYHCALATGLSLRNVTSLVRGKGRMIQTEGEISERAADVLNADSSPRGQVDAPRMVTPPDEVNPEFLAMEIDSNRTDLERLAAEPQKIIEAPDWIPHQILGPFHAAAWLRFTHQHAEHHLAIARDVLAAS